MEEEKEPIGFTFAIGSMLNSDGKERLAIKTWNTGVPSEIVIAFMRNWLKNEENGYHEFFKKEYL